MIHSYRKKPVVVQAFYWNGHNFSDIVNFTNPTHDPGINIALLTEDPIDIEKPWILQIHTLEGKMNASPGDYIIKGVNGEFYPCKPDIFEKTYDIVLEGDWKDRLKHETLELADKLNKLNAFMATLGFYNLPREDKDLLYSQNLLMTQYVQILGKRCELHGIILKESKGEKDV